MKQFLPVAFLCLLFLGACNQHDDQTRTVNKNGGVEVILSTKHIDSLKDLLTTHYKVWYKGSVVKEFDKRDTVPSLGEFYTDGENDNGDDKTLLVKKDYEFYVTVK